MSMNYECSSSELVGLRICLKDLCGFSPYFIAFGKPAGHREVAPREFDVHSRWKPAREAEEKRRRKEDEDKAGKREWLV